MSGQVYYAYSCETCSFTGTGQAQSNEAWGEGVEHFNTSGHEHGKVVEFDGEGYEQRHHPHNHHHGSPPVHEF